MLQRHAEFALGEFASFEFAREASGIPHETVCSMVGASVGAFVGGAFAGTDLSASGMALASFNGITVKWAQVGMTGQAADSFHAQKVQHSVLSAAGVSSDQFASGLALLSTWNAAGIASAHFDYASDAGFDIRCVSSVLLFSSAVANVVAAMPGVASDAFHGVTVKEAVLDAESNSAFIAAGQSVQQVTLSSTNSSSQRFLAQSWAMAGIAMAGVGSTNYRGQAKANSRCAIAGTSDLALYIQPVKVTGYALRGIGQMAMDGQTVMNSRTAMMGTSWSQWLRGRNVFPWLEPAADATIRPEEFRFVERPEELRLVARPEENRATERT